MNRNDLEYENHFAGLDFGSYLIEKQEAADPENTFTPLACNFLSNIINYGISTKQTTKDSLAYFLFDLIPDITFDECAAFCEDAILTTGAQEVKARFWAEHEAAEHARQLEIIKEQAKKGKR